MVETELDIGAFKVPIFFFFFFFAIKTASIVEKQEFTIYGGDIHGSYD